MKKNTIFFTVTVFAFSLSLKGQEAPTYNGLNNRIKTEKTYKNCYYITLNNDTIQTSIIYSDIIDRQHKLNIIEPSGSRETFFPEEIKGFGIRDKDVSVFGIGKNRTTDTKELDVVMSHGMISSGSGSTLPLCKSNVMYFESVTVNDTMKLFIQVIDGIQGTLKYLTYYDVHLIQARHGLLSTICTIDLIYKRNKLFNHIAGETPRKENLWLSRAVADDTVLSTLLKKRRLNIYGQGRFQLVPNIEMIVDEYNNWYVNPNKADTSIRLKAIADAYKYYKPNIFIYAGVSLGYAAFGLPGIILALINYHPIKEKNLHMPTNCKYCSDTTYIKTYKDYANKIKTENIYRARTNGLIGALPFLILVAIIGASANN